MATIKMENMNGKTVCSSPWKLIDIYPNGRLDFCSWYRETLNLKDFIKNDYVDWKKILNSPEFVTCRRNILKGDYTGCMICCPLNGSTKPVVSVHKYGYEREDES